MALTLDEVGAYFQMTCNRTSWPCGCVTWYQRDPATFAWVHQRWQCLRHEQEASHG